MDITSKKIRTSLELKRANLLSEKTDKDYMLWRLLHQSHLMLLKMREKELKKFKISFEESQALTVINRLGGNPTISDISHVSIKSYHTIAALLKRMEKHGLLKIQKGSARKKPGRIALTEKGREALSLSIKRESIKASMSVFTSTEKNKLISLLKKARDSAIVHLAIQDTPEA